MSLGFVYGLTNDEKIKLFHNEILQLYNETFSSENKLNSISECCGEFENPVWLLATWGSRVIGMCTIGIQDKNKAFIYNAAVSKYQRRKGIGASMTCQLLKILKGYTLYGVVKQDNFDAILFFSKMGAKLDKEDDQYKYYVVKAL